MNVSDEEKYFKLHLTSSWLIFFCVLTLFSLLLQLGVQNLQQTPGYMDAEYYYAIGIRLIDGKGFSENFLWNYLNDPSGIPQPSHLYWMPLTSILAALGMLLVGNTKYYAARIFFIMAGSIIPVLTTLLAFTITGKKKTAVLAGILSSINGYYFAYITNTDTFSTQMLLGSLFLITVLHQRGKKWNFYRGLLSGFLHLNRADGILWLIPAIMLLLNQSNRKKLLTKDRLFLIKRGLLIGLGYTIPMGGWYLRNIILFKTLFPPGNSRAFFITNYNQLFSYPPTILTFSNWIRSGINAILSSRLHALGTNLLTFIAVQGLIVLFPLIIMGFWKLRKKIHVQTGIGVWATIIVFMTFMFPFAGERGGFFHSGAAIQPLFFVLASEGFFCFIRMGVKFRQWDEKRAQYGFVAILIITCILITAFSFHKRMFDPYTGKNTWNDNWNQDIQIDNFLSEFVRDDQKAIIINNPPGYSLVSSRPAIMIPDGDLTNLKLLAIKFNAIIIVVEKNHPSGFRDLFEKPGSRNGLEYLGSVGLSRIYKIESDRS